MNSLRPSTGLRKREIPWFFGFHFYLNCNLVVSGPEKIYCGIPLGPQSFSRGDPGIHTRPQTKNLPLPGRSSQSVSTRVSMKVNNQPVSWFATYLENLQPIYIGAIIHWLSTMDIPVVSNPHSFQPFSKQQQQQQQQITMVQFSPLRN